VLSQEVQLFLVVEQVKHVILHASQLNPLTLKYPLAHVSTQVLFWSNFGLMHC